MVCAGCVFVAGIRRSRTWTSGSFESVRWNACVHRLDLSLYSHPKEFLGEWSLNPCLLQGKNPLCRKISPEEDRTHDTVDSEPKHYQQAIPAPVLPSVVSSCTFCLWSIVPVCCLEIPLQSLNTKMVCIDVKVVRSVIFLTFIIQSMPSSSLSSVVNQMIRWGHWWTDFFQIWFDARHDQTLHFDTSLSNVNLQARSQGYEEARTCATILLYRSMK